MNRNWIRTSLPFAGIVFALMMVMSVSAQADVNPNARLSFPPPVYLLRGEVELRGSANLPNQTGYFLSARALNPETLQPLSPDFLPISALQPSLVIDNVLAVWDTTTIEDGVYELRLTVNVRGSSPVTHDVRPIRIENLLPPFVTAQPTAPAASNAPATSGATAVIGVASANVRAGDDTLYAVLSPVYRNDRLPILGISTRGSGWYQVQLPDGRIGWIAPSVVSVEGSLSGLPAVQPPPRPITPTPLPTATPAAQADLVAGIVVLDPAAPTCAQTFTVGLDVANLGTAQTVFSGTVSLTDTRAVDGSVQQTTIGGFPVLVPGQTFRVNMPLTVSTWYNEVHRITLTIDPGFQIPETNEGNNVRVVEYTLAKGACP
jgi:SH3-like domain-containing protein